MSKKIKPNSKKIYSVTVDHYIAQITGGPLLRPLLLNVDSVAGSGKTYTLLIACSPLQLLAQIAGVPDPVFRAAPTGIAVFNFVDKTLHSLLRLPKKGKSSDLSNSTLQTQKLFQDCRFIIIDDKMMIDLKMLSLIDNRLRTTCPHISDQLFGVINMLICRGFFQLPPVCV